MRYGILKETAPGPAAEVLPPAQYPEYDAFVQRHPLGSFMQSPAWGLVKSDWRQQILVLRGADGAICAGMSVLIRPAGPWTLLYAPRGPLCDGPDALRQLLAGAAALARQCHACLLRMDPYILQDDTATIGQWVAAGCRFRPNAPFYATVQPRYNYMLRDIGGLTPDGLMARFSAKTRNKIRHPGKHGVVCKNCGLAGLDDFYALYAETGRRQDFAVRPKDYLAGLLRAFGPHARLYLCYSAEGEPLCGGIAINYGGKCAHVYGCSTERRRELRPTYLLQWTLMCWALETGCTVYDMQGVAIRPEDSPALYGVLGFKQSFKGEVVTTAGEFCVAYSRWRSALLRAALWLLRQSRQWGRQSLRRPIPPQNNAPSPEGTA